MTKKGFKGGVCLSFIDKVVNKVVDRYFLKNENKIKSCMKSKIDEKIETILYRHIEIRVLTGNLVNNELNSMIDKAVLENIDFYTKEINEKINNEKVYTVVSKIISTRIDEIIDVAYRRKVMSVVNEVIDKLE